MSETHSRLARLLPGMTITDHFDGHSSIGETALGQFRILADRLERGDAAVAAVERVRAVLQGPAAQGARAFRRRIALALDSGADGGDRG